MTVVDTNVLLDLVTGDPRFAEWSLAQPEAASLQGPLVINDVVFAELSIRYEGIEDVTEFVAQAGLKPETVPTEALFLPGKAFQSYQRARGTRPGVLPDFFIRAHAAVQEMPLLTRDQALYRTYFSTVELIVP